MAGKRPYRNPVPVSDLASEILDPVLRKRAGISLALVQSWDEVVGSRLAGRTRPEKIAWPRRRGDDDPFEPAVMHIACEGTAALHLQHETGEIINRVNAFLGFSAIGRIKILQKPVANDVKPKRQPGKALSGEDESKLTRAVASIEDENLRAALAKLGESVIRFKR